MTRSDNELQWTADRLLALFAVDSPSGRGTHLKTSHWATLLLLHSTYHRALAGFLTSAGHAVVLPENMSVVEKAGCVHRGLFTGFPSHCGLTKALPGKGEKSRYIVLTCSSDHGKGTDRVLLLIQREVSWLQSNPYVCICGWDNTQEKRCGLSGYDCNTNRIMHALSCVISLALDDICEEFGHFNGITVAIKW